MPTYLQLASEQVWLDQYVPSNLTDLLIEPLREFYGMGPASIGAPGDNNHLYGRHRSPAWDRQSRYCTNRSYGTTDARDHSGDQNWYRAVDVGIQGQVLYDASRRMDQLARSGACPGLAEWFGTFDGQNVVGWFEGGPSSSDDSHLWHLHVGLWTQYANDPDTLRQILATITGEDMADYGPYPLPTAVPQTNAEHPDIMLADLWAAFVARKTAYSDPADGWPIYQDLAEIKASLAEIVALLKQSGGNPDSAPVIAAIRGEGELTRAEIRDAVADLGEGGSAAVRNDPDA